MATRIKMTFNIKKDIVRRNNKRSVYFGVGITFFCLLGVMLLQQFGVKSPLYNFAFIVAVIVGYSIMSYRYFSKKTDCEDCGFDISPVLATLPESSTGGFCPQCGKAIQ